MRLQTLLVTILSVVFLLSTADSFAKKSKSYKRPPPSKSYKAKSQSKTIAKKVIYKKEISSNTRKLPPKQNNTRVTDSKKLPPKGNNNVSKTAKVLPPKSGNRTNRNVPPPKLQKSTKTGTLSMSSLPQTRADKAESKARIGKLAQQRKVNATKNINAARQSTTYKKHVKPNSNYTNNSIQTRRDSYYRSHRNDRTIIIDRSYNTGGYDHRFLDSMMWSNQLSSTMFWYGMVGNPWYSSMMQQQRLSAYNSGDAEVLARLDRIEAENRRLKNQGVQPQEGYLPPNVPAEVAFTTEVLTGVVSEPTIYMSTGQKGGIYTSICEGNKSEGFTGFADNALDYNVKVVCDESNGGNQNIKRYITGKASAMLVQADNLYHYQKTGTDFGDNQYPTHSEPMWLVVNRDSNIDELTDINQDHTIYAPGGAGTSWKVMREFAESDTYAGFGGNSDYAKARLIPKVQNNIAINKVKSDPNAALFVVMGSGAEFLKELDRKHGKELKLIPVNDDRFEAISDTKGQRIYSSCTIPENTLKNLQDSQGMWSSQHKINTLCVDSILVLSPQWVSNNASAQSTAPMIIADTIDNMGLLVREFY